VVYQEPRIGVCIPVLNAAREWNCLVAALKAQKVTPKRILTIDSESTDGTADSARREGFNLVRIARSAFRHGATRQLAVELLGDCDVILFLTQDAVLANPDALGALLRPFEDESVGAVYGRQLPRKGAGPIEAHARTFNYPPVSEVRTVESARERGFKAIFFSNSFGAYRRQALEAVGGFPLDVNFGEDTVVAGRLLLAGWKIAYAADAEVYHSHTYTIREEFRRYVHVGELHVSQPWMIERFGGATGEGFRFVKSELLYLARTGPHLIPSAVIRAAGKILGYQMGRRRAVRTKHSATR
jgi:rhamnosyltransferase